jgi:predicted AlkP superfamily phosphohydrolase/phosphomutase
MVQYDDSNVDKFVKDLSHMTLARFEAARLLIERYDPDLFMVVFLGPDRLQHLYWHILDSRHPRYDHDRAIKLAPLLKHWYWELDSLVGQLLALKRSDTHTIILSDHGFGPALKRIDFNRWLAREGFLNFNKRAFQIRRIQFYSDALMRRHKVVYKWLSMAKKRLLGGHDGVSMNEVPLGKANLIDWNSTRAYSGSSTEQGIWINVVGREPCGVVMADRDYDAIRAQIIAKLTRIRDHETGHQVVLQASRREDIYKGERLENAPDIILTLADGYEAGTDIVLLNDRFIFSVDNHYLPGSGSHRRDGIFVIQGPGLRSGRIASGKNIVDIAPTILHLMGQPVPSDMDGIVMSDIFSPEFMKAHPITSIGAEMTQEVTGASDSALTEEDVRVLNDRLTGLGYLG